MNVAGNYGERYVALEQLAVALGVLSGAAAILQLATGYMITDSRRRGIADDGLVTLYGGLYSLSVSWLALRASDTRSGLWEFDSLLSAAAVGCFLFGIAAPLATLCWPRANEEEGKEGGAGGLSSSSGGDGGGGWLATMRGTPDLSATELLRVRGLLALGVLGAVFIPDCVAFGLGGEEWWARVAAAHASQRTLESSTALFALFATEASVRGWMDGWMDSLASFFVD